ncbi:unnamed protein product [Phaeothamnion confervicola]
MTIRRKCCFPTLPRAAGAAATSRPFREEVDPSIAAGPCSDRWRAVSPTWRRLCRQSLASWWQPLVPARRCRRRSGRTFWRRCMACWRVRRRRGAPLWRATRRPPKRGHVDHRPGAVKYGIGVLNAVGLRAG